MSEPKLDRLAQLWDEHRSAPFPPGFRSQEVQGECMVMMDSMLAGCISVALEHPLDDWRREVLHRRVAILGGILPSIGDEYGTKYFTHLHKTAMLAVEVDRARGR
ncbi:hypothetical protein [Kitasatospora aureofaciens]|uniref:hypothetical protein n=1 Tax=Kitasatospora aureofaciens TaxID=1894 RepID=UPI00340F808D